MSDTTKSAPVAPPPQEPNAPPLSPLRKILVGVIFVILLGALVVGVLRLRGDSEETAISPTTVGTVATTVTTTERPPTLENSGPTDKINWDAAVRSIVAYQEWIYAHPQRTDLLTNATTESNPDYQATVVGLTNLATHLDWHYDPPRAAIQILAVSVSRVQSPTVVDLRVQLGQTPHYRVVDGTGKVVAESPSQPAHASLWTFQRDAGGDRWRVARTTVVQ